MPEKPKRFNKKAIIAIVFIALFVVSIAAVFLHPTPVETVSGYVNVNRSEGYWQMTLRNTTEARYLISYGIYAVADTPKVTITDKAEPHLKQIDIEQETTNVKVTYDEATGTITLVATGIVKDDKVIAQAAFEMDPVDIFAPGERPTTAVTPDKVYWGDKTQLNIDISPFRIAKTRNVTEVGVYTYLTDAVVEISDVSTSPPAFCDPPTYQAVWQYKYPKVYNYTDHAVNYTVRLPTTSNKVNILFSTWVEARYSTGLRMFLDGTIIGAEGYFFKGDSSISYQYEKEISSRVG